MEEVFDFLKKCGTFYIATEEGDQPRVRPFGVVNIFEGKLYNYLTKEDFENILSNIGFNYEIKEYFETISSTDRTRKSKWANLVIKFNKS